jgi:hypothetical protein
MIILIAQHRTQKCVLNLRNVNYIPINKYNIFALGRWDSCRRKYKVFDGELMLYNHQNAPVLRGHKITSNIYKFYLYTHTMKSTDIGIHLPLPNRNNLERPGIIISAI